MKPSVPIDSFDLCGFLAPCHEFLMKQLTHMMVSELLLSNVVSAYIGFLEMRLHRKRAKVKEKSIKFKAEGS